MFYSKTSLSALQLIMTPMWTLDDLFLFSYFFPAFLVILFPMQNDTKVKEN